MLADLAAAIDLGPSAFPVFGSSVESAMFFSQIVMAKRIRAVTPIEKRNG
jgi:hypothetical protein